MGATSISFKNRIAGLESHKSGKNEVNKIVWQIIPGKIKAWYPPGYCQTLC